MTVAARVICLGALSLLPAAAHAQSGRPAGPPGPFVVDLHAVMSSLPQDPAFYPTLPAGTQIPIRSLGLGAGAHVYLFGLGPSRVGIGAGFIRAKGKVSLASPAGSTPGAAPPPRPTRPDVDATVRLLTPQLSLNFGSARGWSYVSAGVGQIAVGTGTSAFASGTSSTAPVTPARTLRTAALQTINVGGGARWFTSTHLAFSFDVRFYKVAARAKEGVRTPAMTLLTASAGISLK